MQRGKPAITLDCLFHLGSSLRVTLHLYEGSSDACTRLRELIIGCQCLTEMSNALIRPAELEKDIAQHHTRFHEPAIPCQSVLESLPRFGQASQIVQLGPHMVMSERIIREACESFLGEP